MNELKEMNAALSVNLQKNLDLTAKLNALAAVFSKMNVAGDDESATAALLAKMEQGLLDQLDAVQYCRHELVRSMGRALGKCGGEVR